MDDGTGRNGFHKLVLTIVTVLIAAAVPAVIHIYARQEVVLSRLEKLEQEYQTLRAEFNQMYYRGGP